MRPPIFKWFKRGPPRVKPRKKRARVNSRSSSTSRGRLRRAHEALSPEISLEAEQPFDYKAYLEKEKKAVKSRIERNKCPKSSMQNFEVPAILESGDFAIILGAFELPERKPCTIKLIGKDVCVTSKKVEAVIRGKKIQYALRSDFTVRLRYAFQDCEDLFLVMEDVDLLHKFQRFNFKYEPELKFIAAQIVLALEYVHTCKIIHRDLRLESIFVSADRYIKLGNFESAKRIKETTTTLCGTLHYVAPEVVNGQPYGTGVDWWSLGVLLYFLVYDVYPFTENGATESQNHRKILLGELEFRQIVRPLNSRPPSGKFKDFIARLLTKKAADRLGVLSGGYVDVRSDPWLEDIDFPAIIQRRALPLTVGAVDFVRLRHDYARQFRTRPVKEDPFKSLFRSF